MMDKYAKKTKNKSSGINLSKSKVDLFVYIPPELFKFGNLILKLFFLDNQPLEFIIFDNSVLFAQIYKNLNGFFTHNLHIIVQEEHC